MTTTIQHYKDPDTEERFYKTPIGDLPSVSTVLSLFDDGKSSALMGWAVKMMEEYLLSKADKEGNIIFLKDEAKEIFYKAKKHYKEKQQEAMDLGSQVHNLIEVYLKGQYIGGLLQENPALIKPFEAFISWQKQYNFELIASERQIYTTTPYFYAGTLDCIAKLNNEVYVIDFKVSNAIRTTMFWQVAAYAFATKDGFYYKGGEEEWVKSELNFNKTAILRLDKTTGLPEFKEQNFDETWNNFDCFCALCFIWWKLYYKKKEKESDKNGFDD